MLVQSIGLDEILETIDQFSKKCAISVQVQPILRSFHDPDYDGEFARLSEQLLAARRCRPRGNAWIFLGLRAPLGGFAATIFRAVSTHNRLGT